MLICNRCGRIISESDLDYNDEIVGYCGDRPYYEETVDECSCGGNFADAVECSFCGEYFLIKETVQGYKHDATLCYNCIDYFRNKYRNGNCASIPTEDDDFVDFLVEMKEIS